MHLQFQPGVTHDRADVLRLYPLQYIVIEGESFFVGRFSYIRNQQNKQQNTALEPESSQGDAWGARRVAKGSDEHTLYLNS